MTISNVLPYNNYSGNGSTTTFDFDFLIESEDELKVQLTDNQGVQTTLVLNTDYTINEVGSESGSYIIYPKAGSSHNILTEDEIITLSLELDIEQEKEFKNSSKLNLVTLEWCLDYITRLIQILNRKMERSVKVQEGSGIETDELTKKINVIYSNIDNINAVNTNRENINAVKNNEDNINITAANINAIISAPNCVVAATTQANVATAQANLAKQYAEETHGQSDVMVENVRAIPAYTNYEYTQTETKGLNDLKQWNRSTFDLSKFTKVGSPTITDDGIMTKTGWGGISQTLNIPLSSEIVVTQMFKMLNQPSGVDYFNVFSFTNGTENGYIRMIKNPTFLGSENKKPGGSSDYNSIIQMIFSDGDIIKIKITFKDGVVTAETSNLTTGQSNTKTRSDLLGTATTLTSISSYIAYGQYGYISQDLKQFSITVDGVEVFNGNKSGVDVITDTLSIPYNLSKTGSKIVDSAYRDRVQSMYEQFGWANYYTLSDTDFTIPMGENMNGHVTKIGWYKNGSTSYEYDTNLDCIETGTCVSGATVMLPKPMADDNYSLSVPYSAKTNVGFIPTASGDYIAKGKILLIDNGGTPPVPPVPPEA